MSRHLLVAGMILILAVAGCIAQESRAALLGRVTDSSDAVVPGVSISITNTSTGVTTTTTTNEQGNYLALYLIPGAYRVVVEKPGFRRYQRDAIELRVNDRLELNITLALGALEETVTITAESPLLDTAGASLGQVVDSRRISELPIPHGNPYMLVALAPGVTSRPVLLNNEPWHFYGAPFSMSGDKAFTNDLLIDGMPATHTFGNNQLIASETPMADLVAEFKVQTTIFDATTGNAEGGAVNYSTKSGTNAFHGTAYLFKMAPEMTANLFFANRAGQPRSNFTYTRAGATLGGPVRFPGLYNGTNRTFFTYGYENLDQNKPRGSVATVPTMKQRQGDFADLLALGTRYQVYDPSTRRPAGAGRVQSDPFPGNIIPPSRISPIAKNILTYYPPPNPGSGTADGTDNLPLPNTLGKYPYWNNAARIDHNLSSRQRFFGRFSASKLDCYQGDSFENAATGDANLILANRSLTVDYVYLLSPSLVANVRGGYVRYVREQGLLKEFDLASLGFPPSFLQLLPPTKPHFPFITMSPYRSTGRTIEFGPRDIRAVQASFDKVSGNHDLKFGTEFRSYQEGLISYTRAFGTFVFDSTYTRGPLDNSPAAPIGQSLAALLLGLPSDGYVERPASFAEMSTIWSFYVQDSWKVTRRLSMNVGLRYEIEGPLTERFNRTVRGFDFAAALPIESAVAKNYAASPTPEVPVDRFRVRGGLTFAGVGGLPRTLYNRDKDNVMPRIGFAYNLTPGTVIRGGLGLSYGTLGARRGDVIQTGFSRQTQLVPTLDNGLSFIASLANPFPNGVQEPLGASLGPMTDVGKSVSFFYQEPEAPRATKWQLSIQRELPSRIVLEAAYVGNRAANLSVSRNHNATPLQYLSTSPVRDQPRIDYLSANMPNPFYPLLPGTDLAGAVTPRVRLLAPYPQFTGVSAERSSGRSSYRSLQARLEKRFAQGFTVQASYTWSRWKDAVGYLNAADPEPSWAVSTEDSPQRFTASGIYELPLGRGRSWLSGAPRVANVLISGWQVNIVLVLQSYAALNWGNVIFTGRVDDIPLPRSQRTVQRWFNVDAGFERDSRKQLSYNVRTFPFRLSNVRGDELNNWDLSLIKRTKLTEKIGLEFRGEFINVFNHVTFAAPSTDPASMAFGTVTSESSFPRQVQLGIKLVF